jgi:hypothetical protein
VKELFLSYGKLIANLWTGTRTKDSMNRLICYSAQAIIIVLFNHGTAVLLEAVRAREVNNQAWIIDETSIYAKIAFSLLSSLSQQHRQLGNDEQHMCYGFLSFSLHFPQLFALYMPQRQAVPQTYDKALKKRRKKEKCTLLAVIIQQQQDK